MAGNPSFKRSMNRTLHIDSADINIRKHHSVVKTLSSPIINMRYFKVGETLTFDQQHCFLKQLHTIQHQFLIKNLSSHENNF